MDGFIEFFVSINKIALVAFIAVLGFLIYEIKKMIDEKKKKEKPVIPDFNAAVQVQQSPVANSTPLPPVATTTQSTQSGNPWLMIGIGVITLIGVIIVVISLITTNVRKQKISSTPVPIVREIQSAGLKIYDTKWKEIDDKLNTSALPGEKLFIGILTIVEADIDRARIKINTKDWEISDITTLFNPQLKVYYKEYIVATGAAQLKIDAQLHSASDGWLGD